MIRKATLQDISRIAEILVFVKRIKFWPIFKDDGYSFGETQVLPVAKAYSAPEILDHIWVYEDGGIVKGLIRVEGEEIVELYVDFFFQNQSVGSQLIEWAKTHHPVRFLWAIEKNVDAIRFYRTHGFHPTGEKKFEEGTTEYLVKLKWEGTDVFYDADDLKTDEIFLRLTRTCGALPEKNWLPAYYFDICLTDGTPVGRCDLRIGHNEKTYIGGNIGYGVDEAFRGHRYAAKACRLLFRQARKHGLDYLIITCDPSNKASLRTCELAGGKYVETAPIPEDNEMYAEGKRQAMIFRFEL